MLFARKDGEQFLKGNGMPGRPFGFPVFPSHKSFENIPIMILSWIPFNDCLILAAKVIEVTVDPAQNICTCIIDVLHVMCICIILHVRRIL